MHVAQVDVHVENEVRDLLHHAGDGHIRAQLLRILHIATAAGLQIAAVRRSIHRGNVEQLELAGFRQSFAQLIADPHQAVMLVACGPSISP